MLTDKAVEIRSYSGYSHSGLAINSHFLAFPEEFVITVFDIDSGRTVQAMNGKLSYMPDYASYDCVALSPGGTMVIAGSRGGQLFMGEPQSGLTRVHYLNVNVTAIAFKLNEPIIALGFGEVVSNSGSGPDSVDLYRLSGNAATDKPSLFRWYRHDSYVTSIAFHPSRPIIASASGDGDVLVYDWPRKKVLARGSGLSVAFDPSGTILACGTSHGTIQLLNPATGDVQAELVGHSDKVSALAFDPTGSALASGGYDHTIRVWDLRSRSELQNLSTRSWTNELAFDPTGLYLASAGGDGIRLWPKAKRSAGEDRRVAGLNQGLEAARREEENVKRLKAEKAAAEHELKKTRRASGQCESCGKPLGFFEKRNDATRSTGLCRSCLQTS